MPGWQPLVVFCLSFAAAVYFKFMLPDADRGGAPGNTDTRMSRLKRLRLERGACIRCGADLADGRCDGCPCRGPG